MNDLLPLIILVPILTILVILVREITRIYTRVLEHGNNNQRNDPEAARILQEMMRESVNEAVRLSEERNRKRIKRTIEDMSDDEIADLLEGKVKPDDNDRASRSTD